MNATRLDIIAAASALVFSLLVGCGADGIQTTPKSVAAQPTVALPAITLHGEDDTCEQDLRVELYVKGQAIKGALVENAGCNQADPEPRFYEFRRSFYRCGTLSHFATLPDGSALRLVDRSASQCMDSHAKPQLELIETRADGSVISAGGHLAY